VCVYIYIYILFIIYVLVKKLKIITHKKIIKRKEHKLDVHENFAKIISLHSFKENCFLF
jgi:hypothetical protein